MGNAVSGKGPQPQQNPKGRVVLWDGSVREFEPPLTAAELMLDHPNQAVVEFQSAVTGKKPPALAADAHLDTKKLYLMLPMKRGGNKASALSGDEIRRVILAANSALRSPAFLPLFARVFAAARKREGKSETTPVGVENKTASFVGLESFAEERDDVYLSRQVSGKRGNWKPSLETIEEKVKSDQKKVSHWLF